MLPANFSREQAAGQAGRKQAGSSPRGAAGTARHPLSNFQPGSARPTPQPCPVPALLHFISCLYNIMSLLQRSARMREVVRQCWGAAGDASRRGPESRVVAQPATEPPPHVGGRGQG